MHIQKPLTLIQSNPQTQIRSSCKGHALADAIRSNEVPSDTESDIDFSECELELESSKHNGPPLRATASLVSFVKTNESKLNGLDLKISTLLAPENAKDFSSYAFDLCVEISVKAISRLAEELENGGLRDSATFLDRNGALLENLLRVCQHPSDNEGTALKQNEGIATLTKINDQIFDSILVSEFSKEFRALKSTQRPLERDCLAVLRSSHDFLYGVISKFNASSSKEGKYKVLMNNLELLRTLDQSSSFFTKVARHFNKHGQSSITVFNRNLSKVNVLVDKLKQPSKKG